MLEVAEVLTMTFPSITFICVCAVPFTNKLIISFQILVNKAQSLTHIWSIEESNNVMWHNFEHMRYDTAWTTQTAATHP